jgi:acyl CoA:acetate/3-ketoacid CoA transferase alpha subunit
MASRKYGAATGIVSYGAYFFARRSRQSAVRDGDTVALEGFHSPYSPLRAATRSSARAAKGSRLIRHDPDLIYDQLIGMGCVSKLVFSWGGNPGVGLAASPEGCHRKWLAAQARTGRAFSRAMANAYEAGAAGCPAPFSAATSRRPAEGEFQDQARDDARSLAKSLPPSRRTRPTWR